MNVAEFNDYWNQHFPACPLMGHVLRKTHADRWFRIHTLPDSKRYPQTNAEYTEVMRRHNNILADLLPDHRSIILLATSYSMGDLNPSLPEVLHQLYPFELLQSILTSEIDEPPEFNCYSHIWLYEHQWQVHSLDPILKEVADDVINNVLLVDPKQHLIYHPYDGGADLILSNLDLRDHLKSQYHEWLSSRSDGM
jgi:hypothetical protein